MTKVAATPEIGALIDHLRRRGLIGAHSPARVDELTGGVSNDVVAVSTEGHEFVVKRALSQLRVADTWLADPLRIDTEARALVFAAQLVPGSVPEVLDHSDGYLAIERAPHTWRTWKDDLLDGRIDTAVAARLGGLLGTWQRQTADDASVERDFSDDLAFEQLRVDPFHRAIAARHPEVAEHVAHTIDVMAAGRLCLSHGDYTPKNVLFDPSGPGIWVIDWEVAHYGDPTFDVAWTVGHLMLKALRLPALRAGYAAAAGAFETSHGEALAGAFTIDQAQLVRQLACLMLARVDGKSPVGYLDEQARIRARAFGIRALQDPPPSLTAAWEQL